MLRTLSGATCRVVHCLCGAIVAVQQEAATVKDAFAVAGLLWSEHTEGLTIATACAIVAKARAHRLDPFDLWMVVDGCHCDDLDHAVAKVFEMRALYRSTPYQA